MFAEFFLLTLYLQDILGYSAVETGGAFSAFALSVVISSNLTQALVARIGAVRTLRLGLLASLLSLAWLTRLPLDGTYAPDLLPAFILGGVGTGLSMVTLTIASLQGVDRADAGVASGLLNTSRQIGGALGLAVASAIAAVVTSHDTSATPVAALDHGFQVAFYALTGLMVAGIAVATVFVRPPRVRVEPVEDASVALAEAA